MKRLLFALTIMTGLLVPLAPPAQAETDISLDFFYDNLSGQGNWIDVADYGYCFQPNVAVGHDNWRPYSDGYWAYTEDGWTWVSYEDFGWATYHYGRWTQLADYGWIWVPGYEWGPAWVSWRTGGDYVGWAPLPPAADRVYEGRAITGHVDVEFDIGPRYYNFVDVRYIGEPVLREHIFAPERNVTIINRTVNVTNITYNNSTVYNYGPDYNRLNQYSARPIQRLSLRRETTVGPNFGAQGGGRHNFNRVNGNQLMVVAPTIQRSQRQIAPPQVKAQVKQPRIEHGWTGISNRQQIQAEMKKENASKIAAPSFQPQEGRNREAAPAGQNAEAHPNDTHEQHAGPAEQAQGRVKGPAERRENASQGQAQRAEQQQQQKEKEAAAQAQREKKQNANRAGQREQRHEEQAQTQEKNKAGKARRDQEQQARRDRAEQQTQKEKEAATEAQRGKQNANRVDQRQQSNEAQAQAEEKNKAKHEAVAQAEQAHKAKTEKRTEKAKPAAQAEPAAERARPNNHAQQHQRAERRAAQAPDQPSQPDAHKKQKKKGGNDEKPDQP
jgi:hypothetical protein